MGEDDISTMIGLNFNFGCLHFRLYLPQLTTSENTPAWSSEERSFLSDPAF